MEPFAALSRARASSPVVSLAALGQLATQPMPSPGGAASVLMPAAKCRVQAAAAAAGGSASCPTPALFIVVTLLKLKTPQDFDVVAQAYKQAVARVQPGELPGGGASRVRLLTAHPTISLQAGMATLSKHPENGCQSNFRWQPAAEASQLHANASTMATRNAFSLAAHTILPSTPPLQAPSLSLWPWSMRTRPLLCTPW